MKKTLLIVIIYCGFSCFPCRAQTGGEWFNQKKTQIRYLLKQIAELQVYSGYVKKGYKIVSGGLNTIHDIKNGEFKLHDLYYKSLELVNPRIRNNPKAKKIIEHLLYILNACDAMQKQMNTTTELPDYLKIHVRETIDRIRTGVEVIRTDLESVITDNSLKMTDDERLRRLDSLYEYSKSVFVFAQKFSSEIITLVKSIRQDKQDEEQTGELYDLR